MNSYYMSTMILPISFLLFVPWVNANAIKESSGYTIKVEGSKVEIIVWNPNHLKAEIYQCDGTRVLLRENVFTKKVVQVQYQCDKGSYIDECVMLGEYRYGFLTPMNCDDSYYGDAFVESHNKSCKDQPEYEGLPPWKGKGRIIEAGYPLSVLQRPVE